MHDIIIIGSGPAGYTAAIYAVRSGWNTLLLEGSMPGGQLTQTTDIENFPGFEAINGYELMQRMANQCRSLGCTLMQEDVTEIRLNPHVVQTSSATYATRAIIIATGATAKRLDIPGGDTFWNNGISACAVCDGALPCFRGRPLVVAGAGDSACEEACHLSKFGSIVYMLVRGTTMRASHVMQERVRSVPNIVILFQTEVIAAMGSDGLERIRITTAGTESELEVAGLFYAIGHTPNTAFLPAELARDSVGYLITDQTRTSIPGVFAAGDVQDATYRQAITAAGSGCMAALEADRYLQSTSRANAIC